MRKREKRIRKELRRIGSAERGHGWAARQAARRHGMRRKARQYGMYAR